MKKINFSILAATMFAASFTANAQGPRLATLQAVVRFDNAPEDISFEVRSASGRVVQTGSNYGSNFANQTVAFDLTTNFGFPLTFKIFDSAGNGLSGNGGFAINTRSITSASSRVRTGVITRERVFTGSNFQSEASVVISSNATTQDTGSLGPISSQDINVLVGENGGVFNITPAQAPTPAPVVRTGINDVYQDISIRQLSFSSSPTLRVSLQIPATGGIGPQLQGDRFNDVVNVIVRDRNGRLVRRVRESVSLFPLIRVNTAFIDVSGLNPGRHFVIVRTRNTSGRIRSQFLIQ